MALDQVFEVLKARTCLLSVVAGEMLKAPAAVADGIPPRHLYTTTKLPLPLLVAIDQDLKVLDAYSKAILTTLQL